MPLVMSNDPKSKTEEWNNKLVGKTIGNGLSDEIVRISDRVLHCYFVLLSPRQSFSERDLPQQTRILAPGSFTTMDYIEDRVVIFGRKIYQM